MDYKLEVENAILRHEIEILREECQALRQLIGEYYKVLSGVASTRMKGESHEQVGSHVHAT